MAATEAEVFSLDMCDDRPPTFREQYTINNTNELSGAEKESINNGVNRYENFF